MRDTYRHGTSVHAELHIPFSFTPQPLHREAVTQPLPHAFRVCSHTAERAHVLRLPRGLLTMRTNWKLGNLVIHRVHCGSVVDRPRHHVSAIQVPPTHSTAVPSLLCRTRRCRCIYNCMCRYTSYSSTGVQRCTGKHAWPMLLSLCSHPGSMPCSCSGVHTYTCPPVWIWPAIALHKCMCLL